MKRIVLIIVIFSSALFFNKSVSGQSLLPPGDFQVFMAVAPGDTSNIFGDTLFHPTTQLVGTVSITLQDTVNVKYINISMGTNSGGTDLFQKNFTFDNNGTFSDGTSYSRSGLNVVLGIGNYTGLNNYYSQVVLQDSTGNTTTPVTYSPNN